jgi:hypothetical protein
MYTEPLESNHDSKSNNNAIVLVNMGSIEDDTIPYDIEE